MHSVMSSIPPNLPRDENAASSEKCILPLRKSCSKSGLIEFTDTLKNALNIIFTWFDKDHDDALNFQELAELMMFTDGETLTTENFEGIQSLVDTNVQGYITFNGFLGLYVLNYNETGTENGDKTIWKDLRRFGFDDNMEHHGNFPVRKQSVTDVLLSAGQSSKKRVMAKQSKPPKKKKSPKRLSNESSSSVNVFTIAAGQRSAPSSDKNMEVFEIDDNDEIICLSELPKEQKAASPVCYPSGVIKRAISIDDDTIKPDPAIPINPFFAPRTQVRKKSDESTTVAIQKANWNMPLFPGELTHIQWCAPEVVGEETLHLQRSCNNSPNIDRILEEPWTSIGDATVFQRVTEKQIVKVYEYNEFVDVQSLLESAQLRSVCQVLALENQMQKVENYLHAFLQADSKCAWIDRYQDAFLADLCNLPGTAFACFSKWLNDFSAGNSQMDDDDGSVYTEEGGRTPLFYENCRVLCGPTGTFKTNIVHHCAKKLGYDVIEINAAVARNNNFLKTAIGEATQSKVILGQGRTRPHKLGRSLVLVDDIDVGGDEDKGLIQSIRTVLHDARCPIVLTCSTITAEIDALTGDSIPCIFFSRPSESFVEQTLRLICCAQGIAMEPKLIRKTVANSNNDIRYMCNNLQFFYAVDKEEIDVNFHIIPFECIDPLETKMLRCADESYLNPLAGECTLLYAIQESQTAKIEQFHENVHTETPPCPQVERVEQRFGPLCGGTMIEIVGLNFDYANMAPYVYVGGVACSEVRVRSPTLITAIVPPSGFYTAPVEVLQTAKPTDSENTSGSGNEDESIEDSSGEEEAEFETPPKLRAQRRRRQRQRLMSRDEYWPVPVSLAFCFENRYTHIVEAHNDEMFFTYKDDSRTNTNDVIDTIPFETKQFFDHESIRNSLTPDTLENWANLQEIMSLGDIISNGGFEAECDLFRKPVKRQTNRIDPIEIAEQEQVVEDRPIGAFIAESMYELGAAIATKGELCTLSETPQKLPPLYDQCILYFDSVLEIFQSGIIGHIRGSAMSNGIFNGNRASPLLLHVLPALQWIMISENCRKEEGRTRRFYHYFDKINLPLTKDQLIRHMLHYPNQLQ